MAARGECKLPEQLLRELTYNGFYIVYAQFNNYSLPSQIPTKTYLGQLTSIFDVNIFNLNVHNSMVDPDLNCLFKSSRCKYYSPLSFKQQFKPNKSALSRMSFSYKHQKPEEKLR